jgi:hypothetical protein
VPKATFSICGEPDSIDVLAFHPATGALLVIEGKSVVPDMQAMLSSLDRKVRLAPVIAEQRGWRIAGVPQVLVLPDDRTARRRIEIHADTINRVMALRTAAVRRWIAAPLGEISGVLFLPITTSTVARQRVGRRRAS